jgi:tetratricopeptide (TPR) repeat protein
VQDFGKAIETNPTNPLPYLERGVAHFGMGEYDRSLEDYQQFTNHSQKTNPFSVPEFSLGFAKGLPQGIYESGRGMVTFLRDVVVHPIHTSQQMWDACTQLYNLGRAGEWDTLREVLAPEVYQLIREWDTISNDQRGKQGGYIFGKYGTDIFVPGTIVKAFSKTVKGAQEFSQVYKRLQTAEQTLLLESASALESAEKVAEVIRTNQTMVALGEEVGLTAAEMIQLQHAGKLQGAIDGAFESLINKPGYEVLKSAINEEKHVKFIRDYFDKSAKELQKSIKSFEKLIVEHKDKIANPSKFIPDWEALHPERKNALVNKKWPAEIQCYTEQRDILQTILNQRIEN